jgi:hypothetical protein
MFLRLYLVLFVPYKYNVNYVIAIRQIVVPVLDDKKSLNKSSEHETDYRLRA